MLDVLLSLALNTASPGAPPSGAYHYQTVGPASTGTSTVTITHGATIAVSETTSGTVMGIAGTASATLMLNADLTPASYNGAYNGGGNNIQTAVTFSGAGANETFSGSMSNPPQTFALEGGAHFAVLDGALVSGFAMLPAQLAAWGNSAVTVVAPVYGRSAAITISAGAGQRPPHVPIIDLGLSVGGGIPFTEWYNPQTLIVDEVDVPSQSITIVRTP